MRQLAWTVLIAMLVGCMAERVTPESVADEPTSEAATATIEVTGDSDTIPLPTIALTAEPTHLPTATPLPDRLLDPAGPWLLVSAGTNRNGTDKHLYLMNADGTGLTRITSEPVVSYALRPGASTEHIEIAYT